MINRIIPLLLFIGFVWGQADLDKLVLKDGTTYFGEYSKIEGKIVFFKPQDAFGFQPVSVKQVERLELKDGQIIVLGGKVKSITLEEYQKLSTKEKAIIVVIVVNIIAVAVVVALRLHSPSSSSGGGGGKGFTGFGP